MQAKLSAVITTFNSARTLATCLDSVRWATEIIVLDSFSSDDTVAIAERYGAQITQHVFMGYSAQKRMALSLARNDWVILLDSDEALSPALQTEIQQRLAQGFDADGYTMKRQEQMFWQMNHSATRMNRFVRLFDRRKADLNEMPIHETVVVQGCVTPLQAPFYHYGEVNIHTKVAKINAYSTGLVVEKLKKRRWGLPLIMLLYPPLFFIRTYLFKRHFLNGWAGVIHSVVGAFYVFLKYAKLYEHQRFAQNPEGVMPSKPETIHSARKPS